MSDIKVQSINVSSDSTTTTIKLPAKHVDVSWWTGDFAHGASECKEERLFGTRIGYECGDQYFPVKKNQLTITIPSSSHNTLLVTTKCRDIEVSGDSVLTLDWWLNKACY